MKRCLTSEHLTGQTWLDSGTTTTIGKQWTYVTYAGVKNGNIETETDPNGVVTRTLYDTYGLYPMEIRAAEGKTEHLEL